MVHRRLALLVPALAVVSAVSACNTDALTKRELVVRFAPDATPDQHRAVLDACGDVSPRVSPQPFSTSGPPSNRYGDVRFRIDDANARDIAQVETCLAKQPGVIGDTIPDLMY